MASTIVKRVVGALIGLIYAIGYGFWTMLITGGGHGNFVWMILFIVSYFFGLFFPIMGLLVVDLRSVISKAIFGSLIFISLAINIFIFMPIILGQSGESTKDFQKTWIRDPTGFVVAAIIHFLPLIVFSFFLVRSIFFGRETLESENITELRLNQ